MSDTAGLQNYRELISRVDALCRTIGQRLAGQLACRKGCDACCRHLSLFPVEAMVLAEAVKALPTSRQAALRRRAAETAADSPCPFLEEHACLVYEVRPVICRTHGLPVLNRQDGESRVDFCPENCRELSSLTGDCIIDIDRLNAALAAINALYLRQAGMGGTDRRVTMAEIILEATG